MMIRASKLSVLFKNPFYLIRSRFSAIRVARISGISHSFLRSTENRRFYSDSRSLFGFSNKASEQIDTQTASVTEEDFIAKPSGLSPHSSTNHPWLEWSKLLEKLRDGGYFDRPGSSAHQDDAFLVSDEDMPEDFLRAAGTCLSFARDQSDLLRTLSRRDIEIVVVNGSPFLFRNAVDSTRRMKSFLGSYGSNELKFDRACTIDLMHFLLSYAYKPSSTSDESSLSNKAVIESSVRNLLSELATAYRNVMEWDHPESIATRIPNNYGQIPSGNKIEMKRGDWICPRCSFMNFARNIKCRDCDEARPKRELSGGDWECPQCCFFNYARNGLCLRCNCKRPGEASFDTSGLSSGVGHFCGKNSNKAEIERILASNEEKAERWFSKVSQMDSAADLSSSIADKDFPEIMPWRKGSNRFIVSTKKTPLERRLANAQYRRNLGNDGTPEEICFPAAGNRVCPDKANETSITQTLDRILGRSSAVLEMGEDNAAGQNRDDAGMERAKFSSFTYPHNGQTEGGKSYHIQVAPSTAETFAKPQKSKMEEEHMKDKHNLVAARAKEPRDYPFSGYIDSHKQGGSSFGSGNPMNRTNSEEEKPKGMGQTNNSDFVPFVPFPSANYFAEKDRQPETRTSTESSIKGHDAVSSIPETWEWAVEFKAGVSDREAPVCSNPSRESWTAGLPGKSSHNGNVYNDYWKPTENSAHKSDYLQVGNTESWKNDSGKHSFSHKLGSTPQHENPMNSQGNWNRGFSAKSLEGSAVKELDPLDMSEEAKAQRWFRRVAQIKDISELSQIPDEDFPQIMPMRKGVNRFVVSKRKTPLERRLTSPQYKRNLPIVNSDPGKKGNERD